MNPITKYTLVDASKISLENNSCIVNVSFTSNLYIDRYRLFSTGYVFCLVK